VDEIFVGGSSAGAIPTPRIAARLAQRYPRARVVQLGDAAGGYRSDAIPGILGQFGAVRLLRTDPDYRALDSTAIDFQTLYAVSARKVRRVTYSQFNTAEDSTQIYFLTLLGTRDPVLPRLLARNFAQLRSSNAGLKTYTAPGHFHTILDSPRFYSLTVDGIRIRDWVAAMLEGRSMANVGDSYLGTP
jgi:pimeloyl-ACP methyl ester carboxylesterase